MKKIRVLIAKPGLDGHDRGALIIAQALRDEGMEVIYTGIRQTPEGIVNSAIQEDVDVIGLSTLSGAHNTIIPLVMEQLRKEESQDLLVVVGGVIPEKDIPFLIEQGVARVFTSGSDTRAIAQYIRQQVYLRQLESYPKSLRLHHVGIAVRSLEQQLDLYQKVMGFALLDFQEIKSEEVSVAFLKLGETKIELLTPLSQSSPIHRFLEKHGEGIHHLAIEVEDINKHIAHLKACGINLINEFPKIGAYGASIAFIHPKAVGGVLWELIQVKP